MQCVCVVSRFWFLLATRCYHGLFMAISEREAVEAGSDAQRRWCCMRCDEKSTDATDVDSPDRADDRSLHDADEK